MFSNKRSKTLYDQIQKVKETAKNSGILGVRRRFFDKGKRFHGSHPWRREAALPARWKLPSGICSLWGDLVEISVAAAIFHVFCKIMNLHGSHLHSGLCFCET